MSKSRRIAAILAAAMATAGLAPLVTAAPAAAATSGPKPVSTWVRAVKAEKTTWVDIHWTTGKKICNAEVTVDGYDVEIAYPSNTGDYTSFSKGSTLKKHRVDRTAFAVRPEVNRTALVPLEATLSYDDCKGDDAEERTKSFWIILPVLKK